MEETDNNQSNKCWLESEQVRRKLSEIGQNVLGKAVILERGYLRREQKEVREGILSISGECGSREKPRSGAKAQAGNVLVMFRNKKETSKPGKGLVSQDSCPRKPDHRGTVRTWAFI